MDDSKIIEMLFSKDENGIKELGAKYGKHVTALSLSILRSKEDAEECVNDTWLKVWDSIPPNRPDNLRAYISKIIRNLCLDRIRRTDTLKRPKDFISLREELTEVFDEGPEDRIEERMLASAINEFVGMLGAERKILFIGRYWHMQSIKELCSLTGLSESNVKTTLFRLREQLREYLQEEGFNI